MIHRQPVICLRFYAQSDCHCTTKATLSEHKSIAITSQTDRNCIANTMFPAFFRNTRNRLQGTFNFDTLQAIWAQHALCGTFVHGPRFNAAERVFCFAHPKQHKNTVQAPIKHFATPTLQKRHAVMRFPTKDMANQIFTEIICSY